MPQPAKIPFRLAFLRFSNPSKPTLKFSIPLDVFGGLEPLSIPMETDDEIPDLWVNGLRSFDIFLRVIRNHQFNQ
jgi:hypothetical protein